MLNAVPIAPAGEGSRWRSQFVRILLLAGWLGLVVVAHIPTHFVSLVGRLTGHLVWVDAVRPIAPTIVGALFWLPLGLLGLGLVIRNRGKLVVADRLVVGRRDVLVAMVVAGVAISIRMWPLLLDDWIKPDFDEGVYLGGAWLLRDGALPYRDFVLPHPPGALLMLWPATWWLATGQDNSAGVLTARITAILCDGTTAGLLYLAARQLVSVPGALLAAAVYASDTLVLTFARGVRLEPLQAPWLAAGAVLLLATLNGRRLGFLAGLCFAAGVMVKLTGGVAPLAAVLVLAWERRWRALGDLVAGGVIGVSVISSWFVFTAGDEIVRQMLLLQLMRPASVASEPWAFLLSDQRTAFTAAALVCGAGALGWLGWRDRIASGWLFVVFWAALTLAMFAYGASFYDHYYSKLVLPAALLAGALPGSIRGRGWRPAAAVLAVLLLPLLWGQMRLWFTVSRAPALQQEAAAVQKLPHDATVVNLMPFTNLLTGGSFARPTGGPYVLDTFLGTLYLDSPLNHRWPNALTTMGAVIAMADYVVTDPWTAPLPGLREQFMEQPLLTGSRTLLFTRVDQPAEVVQVGAQLQLLRRTPGRVEVDAGQRWLVQPLHWRAPSTPPPDQALALHLLDGEGQRVAQLDVPVNGTLEWQPGIVTTLEYRMPLPSDLPPGTYQIAATVYSWTTGQPVALHSLARQPLDSVPLFPVELAR